MRSDIVSHQEICDRMLEAYRRVLGSAYENLGAEGEHLTQQRIGFLRRLRERPALTRSNFCENDIWDFFGILQDLSAVALATGGRVLSVGDLILLGSEATRRECLLNSQDSQVRDWHFSTLIHAYASHSGHKGLQDLRLRTEFEGTRVCDFRLEHEGEGVELLECKRVHPHPAVSDISLEALDQKIYDRLLGARKQLVETEAVLDEDVRWKHALIDVSEYWRPLGLPARRAYGATIQGLDRVHVDQLGESAMKHLPSIDKLTLCWATVVYVDELPLALVQSSSCYSRDGSCQDGFSYGGWTVAAYPRQSRGPEYRELWVSSTARGVSWIATAYRNQSDRQSGGTFWSALRPEQSQRD